MSPSHAAKRTDSPPQLDRQCRNSSEITGDVLSFPATKWPVRHRNRGQTVGSGGLLTGTEGDR